MMTTADIAGIYAAVLATFLAGREILKERKARVERLEVALSGDDQRREMWPNMRVPMAIQEYLIRVSVTNRGAKQVQVVDVSVEWYHHVHDRRDRRDERVDVVIEPDQAKDVDVVLGTWDDYYGVEFTATVVTARGTKFSSQSVEAFQT